MQAEAHEPNRGFRLQAEEDRYLAGGAPAGGAAGAAATGSIFSTAPGA